MLLMIALSATPTVAAIAAAVSVELLVLRTPAVIAAWLAVVAMVTMLAMLPVLRTFRLFALPGGTRVCGFAGLGGGFRWGRRRSGRYVLGGDGRDYRRRHFVVVIARIRWSVWARVAVGIRLALFGGIATIRARPTAATMRASAFGHATMFVMGCLLALTRRTCRRS